jgi:hypothetical protein
MCSQIAASKRINFVSQEKKKIQIYSDLKDQTSKDKIYYSNKGLNLSFSNEITQAHKQLNYNMYKFLWVFFWDLEKYLSKKIRKYYLLIFNSGRYKYNLPVTTNVFFS